MNNLVLSLFPGIDGFGAGFEAEGYCVVRGPDVLWGGDIRRFHPRADVFDVVIGGPPCQAFSALVHLVRANGHEPRFGNLIPEFERVVEEAQPRCFLMENVPQAPIPTCRGYHPTTTLLLNNRWLGAEQNRLRRFCFGVREDLPDAHLDVSPDLVALEEPIHYVAVTGTHNDRANGTVISGNGFGSGSEYFDRQQRTVTSNVGGRRSARKAYRFREWQKVRNTVTSKVVGREGVEGEMAYAVNNGAVTSSDGAGSVKMTRYSIPEAARLQGFPEGFLDDAPFTKDGKLKAIANAVPRWMAEALARAVERAMGEGAST